MLSYFLVGFQKQVCNKPIRLKNKTTLQLVRNNISNDFHAHFERLLVKWIQAEKKQASVITIVQCKGVLLFRFSGRGYVQERHDHNCWLCSCVLCALQGLQFSPYHLKEMGEAFCQALLLLDHPDGRASALRTDDILASAPRVSPATFATPESDEEQP